MLRACRRVLKRGGLAAFLVIAPAAGLSPAQLAAAIEAGPEYVSVEPDYLTLLERAGFTGIGVDDITTEYEETASAWIREWDRERAAITRIVGPEDFRDRVVRRRNAVAAIEAGLLVRSLITARVP